MLYNRNQFRITNAKKKLIKAGKGWIVASAFMFALLGGMGVVSHVTVKADTSKTMVVSSKQNSAAIQQSSQDPNLISKYAHNIHAALLARQMTTQSQNTEAPNQQGNLSSTSTYNGPMYDNKGHVVVNLENGTYYYKYVLSFPSSKQITLPGNGQIVKLGNNGQLLDQSNKPYPNPKPIEINGNPVVNHYYTFSDDSFTPEYVTYDVTPGLKFYRGDNGPEYNSGIKNTPPITISGYYGEPIRITPNSDLLGQYINNGYKLKDNAPLYAIINSKQNNTNSDSWLSNRDAFDLVAQPAAPITVNYRIGNHHYSFTFSDHHYIGESLTTSEITREFNNLKFSYGANKGASISTYYHLVNPSTYAYEQIPQTIYLDTEGNSVSNITLPVYFQEVDNTGKPENGHNPIKAKITMNGSYGSTVKWDALHPSDNGIKFSLLSGVKLSDAKNPYNSDNVILTTNSFNAIINGIKGINGQNNAQWMNNQIPVINYINGTKLHNYVRTAPINYVINYYRPRVEDSTGRYFSEYDLNDYKNYINTGKLPRGIKDSSHLVMPYGEKIANATANLPKYVPINTIVAIHLFDDNFQKLMGQSTINPYLVVQFTGDDTYQILNSSYDAGSPVIFAEDNSIAAKKQDAWTNVRGLAKDDLQSDNQLGQYDEAKHRQFCSAGTSMLDTFQQGYVYRYDNGNYYYGEDTNSDRANPVTFKVLTSNTPKQYVFNVYNTITDPAHPLNIEYSTYNQPITSDDNFSDKGGYPDKAKSKVDIVGQPKVINGVNGDWVKYDDQDHQFHYIYDTWPVSKTDLDNQHKNDSIETDLIIPNTKMPVGYEYNPAYQSNYADWEDTVIPNISHNDSDRVWVSKSSTGKWQLGPNNVDLQPHAYNDTAVLHVSKKPEYTIVGDDVLGPNLAGTFKAVQVDNSTSDKHLKPLKTLKVINTAYLMNNGKPAPVYMVNITSLSNPDKTALMTQYDKRRSEAFNYGKPVKSDLSSDGMTATWYYKGNVTIHYVNDNKSDESERPENTQLLSLTPKENLEGVLKDNQASIYNYSGEVPVSADVYIGNNSKPIEYPDIFALLSKYTVPSDNESVNIYIHFNKANSTDKNIKGQLQFQHYDGKSDSVLTPNNSDVKAKEFLSSVSKIPVQFDSNLKEYYVALPQMPNTITINNVNYHLVSSQNTSNILSDMSSDLPRPTYTYKADPATITVNVIDVSKGQLNTYNNVPIDADNGSNTDVTIPSSKWTHGYQASSAQFIDNNKDIKAKDKDTVTIKIAPNVPSPYRMTVSGVHNANYDSSIVNKFANSIVYTPTQQSDSKSDRSANFQITGNRSAVSSPVKDRVDGITYQYVGYYYGNNKNKIIPAGTTPNGDPFTFNDRYDYAKHQWSKTVTFVYEPEMASAEIEFLDNGEPLRSVLTTNKGYVGTAFNSNLIAEINDAVKKVESDEHVHLVSSPTKYIYSTEPYVINFASDLKPFVNGVFAHWQINFNINHINGGTTTSSVSQLIPLFTQTNYENYAGKIVKYGNWIPTPKHFTDVTMPKNTGYVPSVSKIETPDVSNLSAGSKDYPKFYNFVDNIDYNPEGSVQFHYVDDDENGLDVSDSPVFMKNGSGQDKTTYDASKELKKLGKNGYELVSLPSSNAHDDQIPFQYSSNTQNLDIHLKHKIINTTSDQSFDENVQFTSSDRRLLPQLPQPTSQNIMYKAKITKDQVTSDEQSVSPGVSVSVTIPHYANYHWTLSNGTQNIKSGEQSETIPVSVNPTPIVNLVVTYHHDKPASNSTTPNSSGKASEGSSSAVKPSSQSGSNASSSGSSSSSSHTNSSTNPSSSSDSSSAGSQSNANSAESNPSSGTSSTTGSSSSRASSNASGTSSNSTSSLPSGTSGQTSSNVPVIPSSTSVSSSEPSSANIPNRYVPVVPSSYYSSSAISTNNSSRAVDLSNVASQSYDENQINPDKALRDFYQSVSPNNHIKGNRLSHHIDHRQVNQLIHHRGNNQKRLSQTGERRDTVTLIAILFIILGVIFSYVGLRKKRKK